jgi:hypothetical protein
MAINSFFKFLHISPMRYLLLFVPRPLTYHAIYDVTLRGGSETITMMYHYESQLVMQSLIMEGRLEVACHCTPRKTTQISAVSIAIPIQRQSVGWFQNRIKSPTRLIKNFNPCKHSDNYSYYLHTLTIMKFAFFGRSVFMGFYYSFFDDRAIEFRFPAEAEGFFL